MKNQLFFCIILSVNLVFFNSVYGQGRIITGEVTAAEDNRPLAGATVLIQGTTSGTSTNDSGKYTIKAPANSGQLEITFSGYSTETVKLGATSVVNVSLRLSNNQLGEVVVIGFGSQRKRNITGAISSIKSDELNKSTITNFTQALEGKVAGLTALQSSGQPGASVTVRIRSNPSFASSGVLYVLDGVPISDDAGDPGTLDPRFGSGGVDRSPLNFINPNDIESIEVLKDASAASIYGARAGAGVVLITTKQGKGKKPKLSYNGSYAYQKPANFYHLLNTHDYMVEKNRFSKEIWLNTNGIAPYGNKDPNSVQPFKPQYSDNEIINAVAMPDATKAISQNGFINQHNVSLSGSNAGTRYYISGNYLDQQGVLKGSDYTRYNGRINLDQTINDHLKLGVSLVTSNSKAKNPSVGVGTGDASGMIAAAIIYPPTLPFRDSSGNYLLNPLYAKAANPLSFLEINDNTTASRLLTNGYIEWKVIEGLLAKASFSYDQSSSERSSYMPKTFLYGSSVNGQASITQRHTNSKSLEYTLNYSHDFGLDQTLQVLGGYSYQLLNRNGSFAGNYGFLTDNFLYNNLGLGNAPRPTVGSDKSSQVWASYFGRVIYNVKDKYLFQASIRRDGSSVFAVNKKYGVFPSFSAGWIVSDESFFKKNISFISFLKFRTSYGTTGNSNIGSSAFGYYSSGNNYVFGNAINPGVYLSQLNNDNLTWETAREYNVGLDFQIIKSRISGSVDYFNKTISNLLIFRPLPADFPVSTVADNVGKTRSKGWGIEIKSRNLVSNSGNGFEWKTSFTLSHYYDSWIQRSDASLKTLEKYIDPHGPFNGIYGYVSDGIYNGVKAPPAMPGIIPGVLMIKDLNGYDNVTGNLTGVPDGKISSADQTLLGVGDPNLSFGINNSFHFGNFDLSIYMYGITGKKFNQDYARTFNDQQREFVTRGKNQLDIIKSQWSSVNPNGKYPTGVDNIYSGYAYSSSLWVEKANFLRCRDINLGFTVPAQILQKQKFFSSLTVNLDFQNVFILTKYRGLDPELQSFYAYPNPFSTVFSLSASF